MNIFKHHFFYFKGLIIVDAVKSNNTEAHSTKIFILVISSSRFIDSRSRLPYLHSLGARTSRSMVSKLFTNAQNAAQAHFFLIENYSSISLLLGQIGLDRDFNMYPREDQRFNLHTRPHRSGILQIRLCNWDHHTSNAFAIVRNFKSFHLFLSSACKLHHRGWVQKSYRIDVLPCVVAKTSRLEAARDMFEGFFYFILDVFRD